MTIWENTVLTDKGAALQSKLVNGQTLNITKVMTGAAKVPLVNLRQQTSVTEGGNRIDLQPIRTEENKIIVPVLLENTKLGEGYDLWQIGIYAQDPEEGEILYCLAQASEAKYIPSATDSPGFSITWDFYFKTSSTPSFEVHLDSNGLVSIEQHQIHSNEINSLNRSVEVLEGKIDILNMDLGTVSSQKANAADVYSKAEVNLKETNLKNLLRDIVINRAFSTKVSINAGGTPNVKIPFTTPSGYRILGIGEFKSETSNLRVYNAWIDGNYVNAYIRNMAVNTNYTDQTIVAQLYFIRNI
ncbi:hypothetical protein [Anaerostipes sp.]|uniref:hypothetical protein n=1 Tax=Anaerostipes sp. TaxID=1872530 RepID=UPI0025B7EA95|nr:hypothetical protein [Anaerostipes sp.]MBS7007434.1 hypothetical protein [Anaerostipes sp.]